MTEETSYLTYPWIEKYRPVYLSSIKGQNEIISMLRQNFLEKKDIPHTLFYGPSGVGKTTTILSIINEYKKFIEELNKDLEEKIEIRSMELNATDERGIQIIRDKVKNFSRIAVDSQRKIPFKLVILDEADFLTHDAQTALRRIMEINSKETRFCLICNNVNKIISPILSRCSIFIFREIDTKEIYNHLTEIYVKEKKAKGFSVEDINLSEKEKDINMIAIYSMGDMRKAINILQAYVTTGENNKYLKYFTSAIDDDILENIVSIITKKDENIILKIQEIVSDIIDSSYKITYILSLLYNNLIKDNSLELEGKKRSLLCLQITKTEQKLKENSNSYLQLLRLFTQMYYIINY